MLLINFLIKPLCLLLPQKILSHFDDICVAFIDQRWFSSLAW